MENSAPTTPAPDTSLHFLDYWRIIRIRKTVIFAVFLLVVLTTTVVTYFLPEYYQSAVTISVEKDMSDIPGLFELQQSASVYDPYFIQTEFEKIQSKAVLHAVITNFTPVKLTEKWAKKYNLSTPLRVQETYEILRKRMDVRNVRNTSLIEIRVLSDDRNEAADIANAIAEEYKQHRLNQRKEAATAGIAKFKEKLESQEVVVADAQKKVAELAEKYEINDALIDSSQVAVLETDTVRQLERMRLDATRSYLEINSFYSNLVVHPRDKIRDVIPSVFPDSMLSELLSNYNRTQQELATQTKDLGANHPALIRTQHLLDTIDHQIEARVSGILEGLKNKRESLREAAMVSSNELEIAKGKSRDNAKRMTEYLLAKRELESQKQILQTLNLRVVQEEVDLSLPKESIVQVHNKAEPGKKPVRPNIPLNIILGVIVGLVVGVGLAFFIEYLDTSVKTIDDVEKALGAPVLGVIPQNVGRLLEEGPESPHAEAYRVLRTNLLFSRKSDQWNTVTVVSGGAGEGKSTTVFNLATVFAQNGQRVLVVDSDLRRPSLHKFLGISNSSGLTNYLLKQKTLEEVIQTTSLPTLDFLPSGKLPSSSMGILNSLRMKEFINEVRQRYELVFFDSPPIMGVSDASVLASEVDMTLLVVQYRKYPQVMTLRAKQMVEKVGGNMMGIVLNNINISQDSYYYYYSGYYYDYYYSKRDEEGSGKPEDDQKKNGEQAKLEIKQKY